MANKVYWIGSKVEECQLDRTPLTDVMYDANCGRRGWGNIGPAAFERLGCSLGIGLGQKYERQEDGRWLLVEGGSE